MQMLNSASLASVLGAITMVAAMPSFAEETTPYMGVRYDSDRCVKEKYMKNRYNLVCGEVIEPFVGVEVNTEKWTFMGEYVYTIDVDSYNGTNKGVLDLSLMYDVNENLSVTTSVEVDMNDGTEVETEVKYTF